VSTRPALDVSRLPPIVVDSRALLWWGMVGMMAIEGTMVALLVATYFYLRPLALEWPPPGAHDGGLLLPTLALAVLVASAAPMYGADHAVKERDRRGAMLYTMINIVMAALFLAMRAAEMRRLTFRWDSHAYGSIYWSILGLHTSHVIASTLESMVIVWLLARGHFQDEQRLALRTDGLYWYFVVAAWIPLYAVLYLFPRWQ
jgi:cytochrome c oxidase subunit I+III